MDIIKEAFERVKDDIQQLKLEISSIKETLQEILIKINKNEAPILPTQMPTQTLQIPTENTEQIYKTHLYGLKNPYNEVSIGNEGVPTNQPTNQQTNQHSNQHSNTSHGDSLARVSQILSSFDSLKKEIRLKFKRLSPQEMRVFSIIYELEEQGFLIDYSLLAQKLNLSDISIRDYIRKLISKGIPIQKTKEYNKKITLSISKELKKIATLPTILSLREL